ncbi:hypothetical protein FM038_017125 [Shewanella eurypsychrophilus]|uniref:Uncharacterized protein n=1 Tax=Shewanella eurypsychrophilus TaxID=2593656 RepID=A0ABX6VER6_9GAMM|nr:MULTISPECIES: hypothetical protein [Shewanella]QFU23722.1 hypothetical protein FS418_18915 [Shewanella sp. YLB-09]QPG58942.1 hypothetical protein FM038_017125 [Shewanella eurypsychrophilus]
MAEPLPSLDIKLENSDVGEVFKNKINALVEGLNLNRTEFNNQLAAAILSEDYSELSKTYRDTAEQHMLSAQAISESGLPSQAGKNGRALITDGTVTAWGEIFPPQDTFAGKALFTDGVNVSWMEVLPTQSGHKNKALVSSGVSASWKFEGAYTRDVIADHILVAGDRVFVIATDVLVQSSLPNTIALGKPFLVKNSLKSNSNVRVANPNFTIYDKNENYAPGDNPILVPGEQISLRALSTTELEVL